MIAIYARQSIDKKDSISIETQIDYCKHEARSDDYKVYQDKGFSGKNTNRPAFEQMMKDISSELISKVVVYRLDRISRSIVDFADFINTLEKYNTSFISATEKFDTSAPMGRAMLYIVVVFAQLERETIAERVKDNYYERVKKGGIGGGPAPYGFDIMKSKIDGTKMSMYIENSNIENVRLIFNEYSKPNTTLADVQRVLLQNKITTANGKSWDNSKLSTLLKSPSYVKADLAIYNYYKIKGAIISSPIEDFNGKNACLLVGKREANSRKYSDVSNHVLVVASHQGIIESSQFLYCQEKLSNNKKIKNLHKGKHSWLTGFVKCGYCGYSFSVRISATSEGKTPYFTCSGRYLYKVCDEKQTHRVTDVEEFVEEELISKAKEINYTRPKEKPNKKYLNKIAEIDAKIDNLLIAMEESTNISLSYINDRITLLDQEKKKIINQYNTDLLKQNRFVVPAINVNDKLSFEDKRELAKLYIDKIILRKEEIEIVWK